eukprot:TRINITY_DN837_c0_g1_i3.p1 TRINITY_DN837_c0_g1~~TRINITY_DN837_c0_g1_i3.p1  ORF type:complete len:141 (+),score=19.99 TRINITY_DN837_c0_g1_i3:52-474(+)
MWPLISGQTTTSPRTEIPLGTSTADVTEINGLIYGDYKLLLGPNPQAGWTGPQYPNATTNWLSGQTIAHCGTGGCLYNIKEDPTEHNDIAQQNPAILEKLHQRIAQIKTTLFSPNRGRVDPAACEAARVRYNGYWGPWLN